MPVQNSEIAEALTKLGDLLEIEGANEYRVRAYRNAARTVKDLSRPVAGMVESGEDISELPGIGESISQKIEEMVKTGELEQLGEVEDRVPASLEDLLDIPGLGPKRVGVIYEELGVETLDQLREAAENGRVSDLEGFGVKTQRKILDEIKKLQQEDSGERTPIMQAEEQAEQLAEYLRDVDGVKEVAVAGSYRRRKETVGDLDILVTARAASQVMNRFTGHEDVGEIVSQGGSKSTVIMRSGLQVDLRVVPEVSYGAALHYFTGSKAHNVAVRRLAQDRGLKVNEYGVYDGDERIAGRTEEDVYDTVDLPYIPPELRENRGELEAARSGELPDLVKLEDIRGDLHVHTKATDGRHGLKEMVRAARDRGYDYICVTDHSQAVTVAGGLDAEALRREKQRVEEVDDEAGGVVVLVGIEVDILEDGSLDLPDDVLKELDLTVCSVHSRFDLPSDRQTERIIRAMDNPYFNILGHPTGRMIGKRDPYAVDMEKILEAAAERGCVMELNAHPDRLDLNDVHCKMAAEMGVPVVISTDAHKTDDLTHMTYGVYQARRGWLEKRDVLNTGAVQQLKKKLKRK